MLKNQKTFIESVLRNVNEDTLRKVPVEKKVSVNVSSKALALCYNSYDPSLRWNDFADLVTQRGLSGFRTPQLKFDVIKRRDPKYFSFRDQYILLFPSNMDLRRYLQETRSSSFNRVRVEFVPLLTTKDAKEQCKSSVGERLELLYRKYCRNLEAAYLGSQSYFNAVKEGISETDIKSDVDLKSLVDKVTELEKNCAIVWNLPEESEKLVPQISFFDIVNSFDLLRNQSTGTSMKFVRFTNSEECRQFKKDYHGFVYNEINPDTNKILVEPLGWY
ncbi:Pet54p [Nakaseomyces bracarensis]|uniref:Pet54p n=1 Tax=Nakaseomyces bracarensis TaxID=273131 RepID=UPI0038719A6B